jgi:DNA-binding MarR family transcriptional regulator
MKASVALMTEKKVISSARIRNAAKSTKGVQMSKPTRRSGRKDEAQAGDRLKLGLSTSRPELLEAGGESDQRFRQFLYDFSVLATQLETARSYLASHVGVTSPQYNILMVIARRQGDDGVSVSDVARFLHVSGAFVTTEVRKLEALGLVVKKPNPNDARSTLLSLSAEGEARVRDVEPERVFVNDNLFQNLSEQDFQHLSHTLASMLDDFANTIQLLQLRQARNKRTASNRKAG